MERQFTLGLAGTALIAAALVACRDTVQPVGSTPDVAAGPAGRVTCIDYSGLPLDDCTHGFRLTNGVAQEILPSGVTTLSLTLPNPLTRPQPGPFTPIDLGSPGERSRATGINARGQVAGWRIDAEGNLRAFLWEDGALTDLGTLGGTFSIALALNDRGQVVGSSRLADGSIRAFLWENGTMTDLGTLDGGWLSGAFAINNLVQVTGWSVYCSTCSANERHAFLWDNGTMTDLGVGTFSEGYGVNVRSQVVGRSSGFGAFLWEAGTITRLGTLGGVQSEAKGINDRRQVVGWSTLPGNFPFHAWLWDDGTMTDLGTLPDGGGSVAYAVNAPGQVVGVSGPGVNTQVPASGRAFLWQGGAMTDLGTLGGENSVAFGINAPGLMVGESQLASGEVHATLWTAAVQAHVPVLAGVP